MTTEADCRRLLERDPRDYYAHLMLGVILIESDQHKEAVQHAIQARELGFDKPEPHDLLGWAFLRGDRAHDAEPCFRKAIELKRDADFVAHLGEALHQMGRFDEAREQFREASELRPENTQIYVQWATLELDSRNPRAALDVLALAPWNRDAKTLDHLVMEAGIRQSLGADGGSMVAALRRIPEAKLSRPGMSALGRIWDKLDCYEDAWMCWREGKVGQHYREAHAREWIQQRADFFTTNTKLATADVQPGPQPIFIVGMPRSGTTLIEQMLSAHPDVVAGDELQIMMDLREMIGPITMRTGTYPTFLSKMIRGDMNVLAKAYLEQIHRRGMFKDKPDAKWFTDKQLSNLYDIPLLRLLFPASPIIYVERHPLDVVLSQFANQLTHGWGCAATVEDAATNYKLTHEYLRSVVAVCAWQYEKFVSETSFYLSGLCAEAGISDEYVMREPHLNPHTPRSASRHQVIQPIHDKSINRWKKYAHHLEGAIDILRPTIEDMGYSL